MRATRDRVAAVVLGAGVLLAAGPASGQYVYPTKGQSPQQQQRDQAECQAWATQQPGTNAGAAGAPPPGGQVVRGAGRGAAVGAVGGAIAGNAGKGAAVGAAVGGLVGGMRRADQERAAQEAQAQANAGYSRALAACLEARGYTVK